VERGDTGLGRDAYGLPRRRRLGDRRAYRPDDGTGSNGRDDADDDYGHLLRRPGETPPQPGLHRQGRPRVRPPGRFPPSPGNPADPYPADPYPADPYPGGPYPADGYPPNGAPGNGGAMNPGPMSPGPMNGGPMNSGPMNAGPMNGGSPNGGPMPGRQYRLPNGRRVPPRADRPYRQQAAGPPGPPGGMRGGWEQQPGPGPSGQDPLGGNWRRPPRPQAPGGPPPRPDAGQHAYGGGPGAPGAPGTPGYGAASGFPGPSGFTGAPGTSGAPGFTSTSAPPAGPQYPGGSQVPGSSGFAGGPGPGGGPGPTGGPGFAGGAAGPRPETRETWGRLGTSRGVHGASAPGEPAGAAGQVIRQRETAVPEAGPAPATSAVSIAPDGLESFARDLRALRAKAELDYTEMAETSHYTMKTLVSAAGGLRLPTLPVAVAYVRACGGNEAEWEDRWQKLATKITSDAARKRRGDAEERQALPEPADPPALPELPAPPAAQEAVSEPGEVYVITSAKPRQPGW
jgi:hypothetical protein